MITDREPRLPSAERRPPRGREPRAPRTPFALLLAALFAGGLVLLLVLNTASAANEVQRHDLAEQDAAVTAQLQDLRNGIAASAAPANLAAAAAILGMVPAGNPAFLVVGADGRVSVMGQPQPATSPPVPAPPTTPKPKPKPAKGKPTKGRPTTTTTAAQGRGASRPTGAARPTPRPTPTPTPTLTLPGGPR